MSCNIYEIIYYYNKLIYYEIVLATKRSTTTMRYDCTNAP